METMSDTGKPLTGRKVLLGFCAAFGVIISVNLTLAYQAVRTFPGLEVKNSYVASQSFDVDRAAQTALGWDVSAKVENSQLRLEILKGGEPVEPQIISATLGRATNVSEDQAPDLIFDGHTFVAPVELAKGNWNLRLVAMAEDGTIFRQRIILQTPR